jgi:hypothetical protein
MSSLGFAQSFLRKLLWSSHPFWVATMQQLDVVCTLVLSILLSGYRLAAGHPAACTHSSVASALAKPGAVFNPKTGGT